MSEIEGTEALHPQDRLLIAEALAYWASGHGTCVQPADTADRRKHRAAALAENLLDGEGIESVHKAIDAEWDGSDGSEANDANADAAALVVTGTGTGEPDEADA